MYFKATMDKQAKIVTVCCLLLFIGVGYLNLAFMATTHTTAGNTIVRFAGLLVVFVTPLTCYLIAPTGYSLDNGELTIRRRARSFSIPLANISDVHLLSPTETLMRTFGVGGLYGYFGRYYSSRWGRLQLYTTQQRNRILIETRDGTKIVISPDDVQLFAALHKAVTGRK